jgi:hypothetical protein
MRVARTFIGSAVGADGTIWIVRVVVIGLGAMGAPLPAIS